MDANELFLAKKKAAKAARRSKKEEPASLGMTSLMDIVSIIVVYLLKSYASDPVLIQPIAEQTIPVSRVDSPIQEGSALYVSNREIIFNEKKLVAIKDGKVDENEVKNHLIGPLYDALAEEADKGKQMADARKTAWAGRLILVGDQRLKYAAVVDVLFTAGKAGYIEYALCVIKRG